MFRTISLLPFVMACKVDSSDRESAEPCAGLACPDEITLRILSPDGRPSVAFGGWAEVPDGTAVSFTCGSTPEAFDGGRCLGDGAVALNLYGSPVTVWVDEGDDAPWFSGQVSPAWDAPWDSETCEHYCYIAEETITLEPCDGCG